MEQISTTFSIPKSHTKLQQNSASVLWWVDFPCFLLIKYQPSNRRIDTVRGGCGCKWGTFWPLVSADRKFVVLVYCWPLSTHRTQEARYFWRKFIRRDFTANCSILSCYSPLIYLFFSGQPFRARELKELKCFCVEDEKSLMSWMMAVRIAKVNYNTTVCLRIKGLFPPWQVQIRRSAILRVNFEVIGVASPLVSCCLSPSLMPKA